MEDNKSNLSPEEIEKVMLDRAEEKAKNADPMEQAAMLFGLYSPRFFAGLNKLSSRQLRRLIRALIEVPLVEKMPQFRDKDEKEMFAVGENLLLAKMIMISQSFINYESQHPEEFKKLKENAENSLNEQKGEETNG